MVQKSCYHLNLISWQTGLITANSYRYCSWIKNVIWQSYFRGGFMLNIWTSLLATAKIWYKRPTLGAKATSCTGSVTALKVSVLVHLPFPPILYSRMNTFPPAVVLVSSLPAYDDGWMNINQSVSSSSFTSRVKYLLQSLERATETRTDSTISNSMEFYTKHHMLGTIVINS